MTPETASDTQQQDTSASAPRYALRNSVGQSGTNTPRDVALVKMLLAVAQPPKGSVVVKYWRPPYTGRAEDSFLHWLNQFAYDHQMLVVEGQSYTKKNFRAPDDWDALITNKDGFETLLAAADITHLPVVPGPGDLLMKKRVGREKVGGDKPAPTHLPVHIERPLHHVLTRWSERYHAGFAIAPATLGRDGVFRIAVTQTKGAFLDTGSGVYVYEPEKFFTELLSDQRAMGSYGRVLANGALVKAERPVLDEGALIIKAYLGSEWALAGADERDLLARSRELRRTAFPSYPNDTAKYLHLLITRLLLTGQSNSTNQAVGERHVFFGQERGWLREAFSLLQQVSPPVARDLEGWVEALEQQSDRFDSERGIRTLIRSSVSVQYFVFAGVEVEAAHLLDAHSRREYLLVTPKGKLGVGVPGVGFAVGTTVIQARLEDLKGVTTSAAASFDILGIGTSVSFDGNDSSLSIGKSIEQKKVPRLVKKSTKTFKGFRKKTRLAEASFSNGYAFLFEVDYLSPNMENALINFFED